MYLYENHKDYPLTFNGQKLVFHILRKALAITDSDVFSMGNIITGVGGSNWDAMACVDYLVDLGQFRETPTPGNIPASRRVFSVIKE